jgi:hypothetical protein
MQDETLSASVAVKMVYQWGLLNNLRHILGIGCVGICSKNVQAIR